jgi:protein FAM50
LSGQDLGQRLGGMLFLHIEAMDKFDSSDRPRGEVPTNARFTSQAATAEDLLKAQTVGLVNLNDYRKRRAEALDLKERAATSPVNSGASTPLEEYEVSTVALQQHD